jgi:hypothetical protein
MCGKNFKKVDHIDCKIIAFEVKISAFFAPCKIRVSRLWISLTNFFFIAQSWGFYIIVVKWVENPWKKKFKKEFYSFLKWSLSRKRYVMKGKTKLLITQIYDWIMSIPIVRML